MKIKEPSVSWITVKYYHKRDWEIIFSTKYDIKYQKFLNTNTKSPTPHRPIKFLRLYYSTEEFAFRSVNEEFDSEQIRNK